MRSFFEKIAAFGVRVWHWIVRAVQWLNSAAGHASHLVQLGLLIAAFLTFKYAIVPEWQINVLTVEAEKARTRVADLNVQAETARQARDEVRAELARVTKARDEAERRRAKAEEKVDFASRELSALQTKLAQTQQQLAAREEALSATKKVLTTKEEELAKAAYESVRRDAVVKIINELNSKCKYAVAGQSDPRNLRTCLNGIAARSAGMKDLDETDRRLVTAWVARGAVRAVDAISAGQQQAQTIGGSSIAADIVAESEIREVVVTGRALTLPSFRSDVDQRAVDRAVKRGDVKALLNAIEAQRSAGETEQPTEEARRAAEVRRCLESDEVQSLVGRTATRYSEVQRAIEAVYWNVLQRTDPSIPAPPRRPMPPPSIQAQ